MSVPHRPSVLALIAGFFLLFGCGSAIKENLSSAEQHSEPPSDLVVIYDDHDPEHGGDRIEIHGDGELHGDRWRPGESRGEGRYWEGHVPPTSLRALVGLLVEIQVWEQRTEEEEGRLNDQRARLTVRIGDESATIWEYATDLEGEGRISRVKTHLDALSFEVRHPMADGATDGFGGDRAR